MDLKHELLFVQRRVAFAPSMDQMNPEIAEMVELRRAEREAAGLPADRPRFARKLGSVAIAAGVVAVMIFGKRWGGA